LNGQEKEGEKGSELSAHFAGMRKPPSKKGEVAIRLQQRKVPQGGGGGGGGGFSHPT